MSHPTLIRSPESIKHRAVGVQTDHPVLDSHAVNEGLLVIQEVSVGHPQLVRHPVIQSQVVRNLWVGETLVPPGLLEVHGQGVVLEDRWRNETCDNWEFWPFRDKKRGEEKMETLNKHPPNVWWAQEPSYLVRTWKLVLLIFPTGNDGEHPEHFITLTLQTCDRASCELCMVKRSVGVGGAGPQKGRGLCKELCVARLASAPLLILRQ